MQYLSHEGPRLCDVQGCKFSLSTFDYILKNHLVHLQIKTLILTFILGRNNKNLFHVSYVLQKRLLWQYFLLTIFNLWYCVNSCGHFFCIFLCFVLIFILRRTIVKIEFNERKDFIYFKMKSVTQ